jgi:hypothetical protein
MFLGTTVSTLYGLKYSTNLVATLSAVRISHGIVILEALGEGSLLVSTKKRPPNGYYSMAECSIEELRGKSEDEIFAILDKRTDEVRARKEENLGPVDHAPYPRALKK